MVFFRLLGPSKASHSEITFSRWRLRQERKTRPTSSPGPTPRRFSKWRIVSDQRNSRNAGRFKYTNQRLASSGGFERRENRFETAWIPWIPLIAEFCTDHIKKAIFVTLASIFSETVGGMELKFGEEIEENLIYQDPSPFRWDFQCFCVNSSLKSRRSRLTAAKLQALSPFLVLTVTGQK